MDTVLAILVQVGSLVGVAAAIAALINVGKQFGWIKDGQAGSYSAGLNLIAIAVLVVFKLYRPDILLEDVDVQLGAFAQIMGLLLTLMAQIKVSSGAHAVLVDAGIPVVGKSFSEDNWKKIASENESGK